jgi:phosphatidylserine decarboxylase
MNNTRSQATAVELSTGSPSRPNPRWRDHLLQQEDLNFLLTNRIPRIMLTRWMGWFSKIEHPLICRLSIWVWRLFTDLDLNEAKKARFTSLHDCFTRELRDGARTVERSPDVMASPCDAIVGACGRIDGTTLIQAKGFPYSLGDLLGSDDLAEQYRDGTYVTLRLTSSMYHRFHAPLDCRVTHVTYISGDTWNVNPIALKRVERLFCKNERAVIHAESQGRRLLLVPVAAVLVASIRLHFLNVLLHLRYRGPNDIPCDATFPKGAEMGWFEHGSTIIVVADQSFALCEHIGPGTRLMMGQRLMRQVSQTS